jgi:hypothetical protein
VPKTRALNKARDVESVRGVNVIPGQAVQVPGVNGAGSRTGGAGSGCERCRFRVSTVQVPKQGLNLHRESAFCVAPVAQVSALKWNLRH